MINNNALFTIPFEEIKEIEALPFAMQRMFAIAGAVNYNDKHITLFRGDGTTVIAPFDLFVPNPTATPDFNDFEIIDYGTAVRLGNYEMAFNSILHFINPELAKEYDRIVHKRE